MAIITTTTRTTIGRSSAVRACIVLLALMLGSFRGPVAGVKEYEVKAACLYNFAKFVTYPESAFVDALAPFVIGVLGDDPFGEDLDAALKGKTIGKRPIVVERYAKLAAVRSPHILFVARSETDRRVDVLHSFKSKPTFLVGDMDGFAEVGGTANFYIEKNNLRFAINTDTAKASKLQVSGQLLKMAKVVP